VRREPHPGRCPAHVTLKTRRDVPTLRSRAFIREFKRSLREASERGEFRVVHYSIQRDHVHLIVEAAGCAALGRGMKSIAARLARAANRVFQRSGPALLGRYHVRALMTPREVRNALAYVLLNARRHWAQKRGSPPPVRLDEGSSGAWFDGWKRFPRGPTGPGPERRGVAVARTWLLSSGWRRHGLVDPGEVPGGSAARAKPWVREPAADDRSASGARGDEAGLRSAESRAHRSRPFADPFADGRDRPCAAGTRRVQRNRLR
jgi:REP element-mobilizing transposase RayT